MTRKHVVPCSVFGGRSPKTGKPVGRYHRWSYYGVNTARCDFCGRTKDEVMRRDPK